MDPDVTPATDLQRLDSSIMKETAEELPYFFSYVYENVPVYEALYRE